MTDNGETLARAIGWLVIDGLADDVGEERLTALIGEAVSVIVAAERGDPEAQRRVQHAARACGSALESRRDLIKHLAARPLN